MHPFIFIAIVLAAVLLVTLLSNSNNIKGENDRSVLPYAKRPYLMTNAERAFFKVLHLTVQDRYYVVPQVQLSKIVQVVGKDRWKHEYKNKINLKSVDFVLFDKEYFTPQVVIELDDSSHEREDRRDRDIFLDTILKKAGIKILHIKTARSYNLRDLM